VITKKTLTAEENLKANHSNSRRSLFDMGWIQEADPILKVLISSASSASSAVKN